MLTTNWSWKPDYRTDVIKTHRKKKANISRKRLALKEKKERLLKHFKLHKYASWVAIAEMICKETGKPIPTTNKACKTLAKRYRFPAAHGTVKYSRHSDDKFYQSVAWKELRYIALKQSGGCCTLCGARASDGVSLHVDHIIPRSKDARLELDLDNLQILCSDCNIGKSNRDSIDWRYGDK